MFLGLIPVASLDGGAGFHKMKALIMIAAIFGSTTSVHADEITLCPTLGILADTIMEARQANVPMSSLMEMGISDFLAQAISNPENLEAFTDAVKTIIKMAYNEPLYSSDTFKSEARASFRNTVEAWCYSN